MDTFWNGGREIGANVKKKKLEKEIKKERQVMKRRCITEEQKRY